MDENGKQKNRHQTAKKFLHGFLPANKRRERRVQSLPAAGRHLFRTSLCFLEFVAIPEPFNPLVSVLRSSGSGEESAGRILRRLAFEFNPP
jgi:hypothetical protein